MHRLKILVAEGSADHRGAISERLNEWGYEVVVAGNGRQTLEFLARQESGETGPAGPVFPSFGEKLEKT